MDGMTRFLTYMWVHDGPGHLWSNLVTQLTIAWLASIGVCRSKKPLIANAEIALVYLSAGIGGGLAFQMRHRDGDGVDDGDGAISLVGCSAGAFGLAGLCIFDTAYEIADWFMTRVFNRDTRMTATRWTFLAARTICCTLVVGYDVIALISGDVDAARMETIAVHLAGLVVGLIVAFAIRLAKIFIEIGSQLIAF